MDTFAKKNIQSSHPKLPHKMEVYKYITKVLSIDTVDIIGSMYVVCPLMLVTRWDGKPVLCVE